MADFEHARIDKRKASELDLDEELEVIMNKHLKIDPVLVKKFMDACISNNVIMLNKYLKEQNISPFMTDSEGKTPLIVSVIAGSKDAALTLMKCKNSNFNHLDMYGHNALYYACLSNNLEMIKLLMKIPNIKIDSVVNIPEFVSNPKINELFTKVEEGSLKTMRYSKFNPREVEDNPQRRFRAELIKMYGKCLITGKSPEDCDYIHICNPSKNKIEPYNPFNGLIMSHEMYRKYYKKNLIKFNLDSIRKIDQFTMCITLITSEPEILQYNGREIWLHVNSIPYFNNNKPKPILKKKWNSKKGNLKMDKN